MTMGLSSLARLAALLVGGGALAACAVGNAPAAGGEGADPSGTTGEASLRVAAPATAAHGARFVACSDPTFARYGYVGDCATVRVPLDYAAGEGGAGIDVLVNRIVSASASGHHARGQLWLLQGGPGGTAAGLAEIARGISSLVPDLDVYAIEHRGVAASAGLTCQVAGGGAGDGLDACVASLVERWGSRGLAAFSTTNAALDLTRAVDATRAPGEQVYVYGVSYGTYWAQRYLQVAPAGQASGVVLDSILPPVGQPVSRFDEQLDPQAKKLAAACATDAACSAALGADPWSALETIRDHIAEGHCPGTLDATNRRVLATLLESWQGRPYALAAMARYERCAPEDVLALSHLVTALGRTASGSATATGVGEGIASNLASPALAYNVLFSELYESPPPDASVMAARYAQAVFPAGAADLAGARAVWPTYGGDSYVGTWATSTTPMLMMNGTLDFQTPIESARTVGEHFTGAHQTFVEIPNAAHGVLLQSPVRTAGAPSCGMQIAASFLRDPLAATPDTSCVADLAPLSFAGATTDALRLFGTTDAWAPVPQAAATTATRGLPYWLVGDHAQRDLAFGVVGVVAGGAGSPR